MAATCTKLYIIPDDLEEEDEKVTIHVSPIAPDVLSEHSQMNVAVTLLNDDGMLNTEVNNLGEWFNLACIIYLDKLRCRCTVARSALIFS